MILKSNQILNKNDLQYEKHYANITQLVQLAMQQQGMAQEQQTCDTHQKIPICIAL